MKGLVLIQIAIDGPAGAGKSTIARQLADRLGFIYVDTGSMYRAITYAALQEGLALEDGEALADLAARTKLELVRSASGSQHVFLNGCNVSEEIRSPLISQKVSLAASHPGVREALVQKQREMAAQKDVVMDGRDICTVVLPQAEVKVFLTASLEERARRRYEELKAKGYRGSLAEVTADVAERDELDRTRPVSPLRVDPDALYLDTTDYSLEQVCERIYALISDKKRGHN